MSDFSRAVHTPLDLALIRRVKFLSFPFTFGYEDQRAQIEARGQVFRSRDDSLQEFMKTDRARAL